MIIIFFFYTWSMELKVRKKNCEVTSSYKNLIPQTI